METTAEKFLGIGHRTKNQYLREFLAVIGSLYHPEQVIEALHTLLH